MRLARPGGFALTGARSQELDRLTLIRGACAGDEPPAKGTGQLDQRAVCRMARRVMSSAFPS